MCGILGLINPRRRDWKSFERALSLISHRGPDHSEVKNIGPVVLGHCRLSIQDLSSAGNQPMSNFDQTVWIVFNGEIYLNRLRFCFCFFEFRWGFVFALTPCIKVYPAHLIIVLVVVGHLLSVTIVISATVHPRQPPS